MPVCAGVWLGAVAADKFASRGPLSFTRLLQMNGYWIEEIDPVAPFRKREGIVQPIPLSIHIGNNVLRLEKRLTPSELFATLMLSKIYFSN